VEETTMDLDIDFVAQKILAETGTDIELATIQANQLTKIHKDLYPVVEAWLKDEFIGFEFKGVTLDMIMEKECEVYIEAVFGMWALLDDPEMAEMYPKLDFARDFKSLSPSSAKAFRCSTR
jgi:hypothetical protein